MHLPHSNIKNIYYNIKMLIPCMVIFQEQKSLSGIVQMCSSVAHCKSLGIEGIFPRDSYSV